MKHFFQSWWKLILAVVVTLAILLFATGVKAAQIIPELWLRNTTHTYLIPKDNSSGVTPNIGATGDRVPDGFFDNINTTTLVLAGAVTGDIHTNDDSYFTMGNTFAAPDASLGWNTTQTVDGLFMGLSAAQNTFIIAERADAGFDFAHGAQSIPTLFIQSANTSTTEFARYTAGNIAFGLPLAVVATEYSVGRDADATSQLHFNVPTSATFEFSINDIPNIVIGASDFNIAQVAAVTGTHKVLAVTAASHTSQTASADLTDIDFNLSRTVTQATGAVSTMRSVVISPATYAFIGSSTITTASTLNVGGAPAAGSNATFTNAFALQTATFSGHASTINASIFVSPVGISNGIGAVSILSQLNLGSSGNVSLGNQTATLTNLHLFRIDASTFTSTTNVRTVTNPASFYVSGEPIQGANIVFTNTSLAVHVDSGLTRLDGGVIFAGSGQSTLDNYTEGTFTPTVTLVGGAGNTVPVYSTNTGRHTRVGRQVFADVYLTGDGGAEGAGTGRVNIALPVTASASHPTSFFPCGYANNGTTEYEIYCQISGSATTAELVYFTALNDEVDFTGADQNNTTRIIRLKFNYEA